MEKKFELVERLKVEKCCFTGKVFDCGRCQLQPERIKPPCGIHMGICIDGYIEDNAPMREYNRLAKGFNNKAITGRVLREYFCQLYALGVRIIPVGECSRFCYRHGCMGHKVEDGAEE